MFQPLLCCDLPHKPLAILQLLEGETGGTPKLVFAGPLRAYIPSRAPLLPHLPAGPLPVRRGLGRAATAAATAAGP